MSDFEERYVKPSELPHFQARYSKEELEEMDREDAEIQLQFEAEQQQLAEDQAMVNEFFQQMPSDQLSSLFKRLAWEKAPEQHDTNEAGG